MDTSKDSTGSSKHVSQNNFNKDLNGMILFGKPQQPTTSSPQSSGFSPFFSGCEANAKHMILAEETTKYLGDNEGVSNVQLMMKLLQVVAYNLVKSRTARDGNRLKRKNFRPRHIKINHPVLVRNHTTKPFEARSNDYICVGFEGNNRILVKDNHGKIPKVNRKDITPIEMDIKIAELFKESRQN